MAAAKVSAVSAPLGRSGRSAVAPAPGPLASADGFGQCLERTRRVFTVAHQRVHRASRGHQVARLPRIGEEGNG